MTSAARFPNVSCSQCSNSFGPGEHGFSHCRNHAGLLVSRMPFAEDRAERLIAAAIERGPQIAAAMQARLPGARA